MTVVLLLALARPPAPVCAPMGQSTMDPTLEHARGISVRRRVREPLPLTLVAMNERVRP